MTACEAIGANRPFAAIHWASSRALSANWAQANASSMSIYPAAGAADKSHTLRRDPGRVDIRDAGFYLPTGHDCPRLDTIVRDYPQSCRMPEQFPSLPASA